ncbi:MAG: hypothetical protein QG622_2828 [Actinomycetota bacterium]|nr:hypothetical protein [Actinomycetota bacterium]
MSDLGYGVSAAAVAAAAARAVESSRDDRLVDDPFAALLVEAADVPVRFPLAWPDDPGSVPQQQLLFLVGSVHVGLRTRFVDDWLRRSPTGQVVLLGAGLDTRAYRLAWADGTTVFEVDQASVLAFTDRALAAAGFTPACTCHNVPVDVTSDWREALRAAGLDTTRPVTWIVEGLLPYLNAGLQEDLFEGIVALSAPGSCAVVERATALPGIPQAGPPSRSGTPDPARVLADAGWAVGEHPLAEVSDTYHRPLIDPGLAAALVAAHHHQAHFAPHPSATGSTGAVPSGGGFVTATSPAG